MRSFSHSFFLFLTNIGFYRALAPVHAVAALGVRQHVWLVGLARAVPHAVNAVFVQYAWVHDRSALPVPLRYQHRLGPDSVKDGAVVALGETDKAVPARLAGVPHAVFIAVFKNAVAVYVVLPAALRVAEQRRFGRRPANAVVGEGDRRALLSAPGEVHAQSAAVGGDVNVKESPGRRVAEDWVSFVFYEGYHTVFLTCFDVFGISHSAPNVNTESARGAAGSAECGIARWQAVFI